MSKSDYKTRIAALLGFLKQEERDEVLSDIEELYDGLSGRGMTSKQVEDRIGPPETVAGEYRFARQLDRVDRAPTAASSLRAGFAALTGRFARGIAFQLLGLVWLIQALVAFGVIASAVTGLLLAVSVAAGFDPVVTTLAVPGIPVASGVLMGVAVTLAAVSILLANRLAMRALSRLMRERLTRHRARSALEQPAERRWIDSGHAVGAAGGAALLVSLAASVLMFAIPAPSFPLIIDRFERFKLPEAATIKIRAHHTNVRLVLGDEPAVRLAGEFKRTFAQAFGLHVVVGGTTVTVESNYREGLSWGINRPPVLVVTLPAAAEVEAVIVSADSGTVDLTALPDAVRRFVRMEEE